jgi:hypothetical protein
MLANQVQRMVEENFEMGKNQQSAKILFYVSVKWLVLSVRFVFNND